MSSLSCSRLLCACAAVATLSPVLAQDTADPDAARKLYGEVAVADAHTRAINLGVTLPLGWRSQLWGGALSAHVDGYISQWRADSSDRPGRREALTQVALVPVLRLRFDEGRSPWFLEGGIGVSLTDSLYRLPRKVFSTRFNFADHLGIGRDFGPQRRHTLMLAWRHVSNADIKRPNPGEDFIQIRYAVSF